MGKNIEDFLKDQPLNFDQCFRRFPWRGNPRVCSRGKNSKPFKNCVSDPFANFDYVSDDRLDEI